MLSNFKDVIATLEQQKEAIDKAITALSELGGNEVVSGESPKRGRPAKAIEKPVKKKRVMSEDGRRRIAEASRKRWVAVRKAAKKAAPAKKAVAKKPAPAKKAVAKKAVKKSAAKRLPSKTLPVRKVAVKKKAAVKKTVVAKKKAVAKKTPAKKA